MSQKFSSLIFFNLSQKKKSIAEGLLELWQLEERKNCLTKYTLQGIITMSKKE
jgi:hypothetical protein